MWYNTGMKNVLKPTLWRTCRALMNPMRLNMLRLALEGNGCLCVRDYARGLGLPDSIASIYLRQLNARGLIGVRRDRIKVFYNAEQDRTLPDSAAIQKSLALYFAGDPQEGWETEIMTILRAFSHFNRLAILIRLADAPATLDDLFDAMGVCVKSVYHHLAFLSAASLIREEKFYRRPSVFHLVRPEHPFARTLLRLLLADSRNGGRYYNEGSTHGDDTATCKVLKKIRESEGRNRENWSSCGPMKSRRGNFDHVQLKALADDDD